MNDEVKITFEYLLGIFIVGHAKFQMCLMNPAHLGTNKISIDYEDYIKSNLHLDVISDFYNKDERSIYQYYNARKFLTTSDARYRDDAVSVLKFMLEDIASYLIKVPAVYHVRLSYPEELLPCILTDNELNSLKLKFRRFVRTALADSEWEQQFLDVEPLPDDVFLNMSTCAEGSTSIVQLIKRTQKESLNAEDIATRYVNLEQALVWFAYLSYFNCNSERSDIAV